MRVLLLGDSRSFHIERLKAELERQDCEVVLASLEDGSMKHLQLKGRGPIRRLHYLLALKEVRATVKKFRPDVINAHFAPGYGYLASRLDRSVPLVLNVWGSDVLILPKQSIFGKYRTRKALRGSDCVIGDSMYLVDAAKELTQIKSNHVIPWGIEKQHLVFHKGDYSLGRPLKIIVPRAHESVYNNILIVRALEDMINDGRVSLTFPSFGSLFDSFRRECRDLVGDKISFYDKLPREEFMKFMAGHDLFVSASRSDSSPASLIEAMGLGLIPVAADIPGVREWLTAESGFLFTQDAPAHLASIIENLIDGDDPHSAMRQQNFEKVQREAVFEENVARQIAVMREVVESR